MLDKMNLENINYCIMHEEKNDLFIKSKYRVSYLKLGVNVVRVILKGLYGLFLWLFIRKQKREKTIFLFLYFTGNNKKALSPIQEKVTNSLLLGEKSLEIKKSLRYSLIYIPIILQRVFKERGYLKRMYITEFAELCYSYGYYQNALANLRSINPNILILSNDHSPKARAYLNAAKELDIKTAYVQHASVSSKFPPLEFDYAFLDGLESLEKYEVAGTIQSSVYLSGGSRFDVINTLQREGCLINQDGAIDKRLGISLNLLDDWDKVYKLIEIINREFPLFAVQLRPHPSINFKKFIDYFDISSVSFSNPLEESPYIYISNNDIFIAGDSSIHLDTVLVDKESLYYNFTIDTAEYDVYGYIKNGLIIDISSNPILYLKQVVDWGSTSFLPTIERRKYYVENFGTKFWGKSSSLIAETLINVHKGLECCFWKEKNGVYILP